MSASDTGEDCPLVHCLISVRNMVSASAPASRTVRFRSAASLAMSASATSNRQSFDAHGRRVDAVLESEVVGRRERLEHVEQVAGDRHLADRIAKLAVLDPEAAGAAAVVAGHTVDARADQLRDVKAFLDVA